MSNTSEISSISSKEESFEKKSYKDTDSSSTDSTQIKEKFRSFNKRKRIIFITIAILILMIIIIIATMIPFIYFNNKTTKQTTTSSTNNSTESISVTTATTYDIGGGGVNGGPPCTSYTVVNDPSRNVNAPGMGGACDTGSLFNTSIGGRWIRFMGTGGTMIPTTTPGVQHCGAFLSGWFMGTLPSIAEIIVNASVCFDLTTIECGYQISISVVNCANFYVYFLPPMIVCNARYCTI